MNGKSVIQCGWNDPESTLLFNPSNPVFQDGAFTMACSFRLDTLNLDQAIFSGGSYDGLQGEGRTIWVSSANKLSFNIKNVTYETSITLTTGVNYVALVRSEGISIQIYYNGSLSLTVNPAQLITPTQNRICIGSNTSGGNPSQGFVGECLYWNIELDNNQTTAVNNYLINKWV